MQQPQRSQAAAAVFSWQQPPLSPGPPRWLMRQLRVQAARVSPRDPDLRRKLAACEKAVKELRFAAALATPVSEPEGGMTG